MALAESWWDTAVYNLIPVEDRWGLQRIPSEEWVWTSLSEDMKRIKTTKEWGLTDGVGIGMQNQQGEHMCS